MSTYTATRTATVAATETRVNAVLRQVHVDFTNAVAAQLATSDIVASWRKDLTYMLQSGALEYFEIRIIHGQQRWRTWRFTISDDGTLLESSNGGGINFFGAPSGSVASLVIKRRADIQLEVSKEIDRLGWTTKVEAIDAAGVRERAYSKDHYGVVRHMIEG